MDLHFGLKETYIKSILPSLSKLMADHYVLAVKTKNFHWNVKGPLFSMHHELFDELYGNLIKTVDDLAERIRTFGGRPPSSLKEILSLKTLEECEVDLAVDQMIKALLKDYEALIRMLREICPTCQSAADEATADMFIELLRAHEKTTWILRSHLGL
jgi:starvation-inducible DNA-binding protein